MPKIGSVLKTDLWMPVFKGDKSKPTTYEQGREDKTHKLKGGQSKGGQRARSNKERRTDRCSYRGCAHIEI